ncbi:DUF4829 domain-containing protein [Enterococcus sp. LJL99]
MKNKKFIALTLIALTILCIYLYQKINPTNKKSEISIVLDSSTEFSKEELEKGAEKVLSSFNSMWSDSKLHEIRFDNDVYQREMTNREPGTSLFSDLDKDNVLIFTISFTTGPAVKGSLGSNMSIDEWQFILSRQNKLSPWKFLDQDV